MDIAYTDEALIKHLPGFSNHYTRVNEHTLHYVMGGHGTPILLIPGYPETWWAYHKVMPLLAKHHQVIVVDIRGMGSSAKAPDGYTKKNMAKDLFDLVEVLNLGKVAIGGHDIGAHVAFSFAANYPTATAKLLLLDTPHPDTGMYQLPMLPILGANYVYPWWLAFNQVKDLPEQLLEGRMDIVIDWLYQHLLVEPTAVSPFDKAVFTAAYNSKESIRAANAWYQAFPQDIEDATSYAKLTMPVLGIGGSGYALLEASLPHTALDFRLEKVEPCGHFLLAEKPMETAQFILNFLAS